MTLGELLSSKNEIIKRNAISILKILTITFKKGYRWKLEVDVQQYYKHISLASNQKGEKICEKCKTPHHEKGMLCKNCWENQFHF